MALRTGLLLLESVFCPVKTPSYSSSIFTKLQRLHLSIIKNLLIQCLIEGNYSAPIPLLFSLFSSCLYNSARLQDSLPLYGDMFICSHLRNVSYLQLLRHSPNRFYIIHSHNLSVLNPMYVPGNIFVTIIKK